MNLKEMSLEELVKYLKQTKSSEELKSIISLFEDPIYKLISEKLLLNQDNILNFKKKKGRAKFEI